jgi:hypothetical protein
LDTDLEGNAAKEVKTMADANKDPEYSKKLEENSRRQFGRAYKFLTPEQKKSVQSITKFEPKKEEQKNANIPISKDKPPKAVSQIDDEEEAETTEVLTTVIVQFKCKKGHKTNGTSTAPALRCRVCRETVKKTGQYENDIFVPVA